MRTVSVLSIVAVALLGMQAVVATSASANSYADEYYGPAPMADESDKKDGLLASLVKSIGQKAAARKAEKEVAKVEKEMAAKAKQYEKLTKQMEQEKKEKVPEEVYYSTPTYAPYNYAPATTAGTPYCFPQYVSPEYSTPVVTCPTGYTATSDKYGGDICIKKRTTCGPGQTLYSNSKCCNSCPEGFTQKGMTCYGPSKTTCYKSATGCPADCTSVKVCPPPASYTDNKYYAKTDKQDKKTASKDAYAPADPCYFKCCKTEVPTYTVMCTDPHTFVDTSAPTVRCAAGKWDTTAQKCLVSAGGWSYCPEGGKKCVCTDKKGKPIVSMCTTTDNIFGVDTCKFVCECMEGPLEKKACPINRTPY